MRSSYSGNKKRVGIIFFSAFALLTGFILPVPLANAATVTPGWIPIGPAPIVDGQASRTVANASGRVDAITISGQNIYIGAANGGVWKSGNDGQSWSPLSDAEASLAIGCVTVDSMNPNIIYAGTGELHYSGDCYFGRGILKSTDGGNTWMLLGETLFSGKYISQIVVNPGNDNELLVSCDKGVYKSTDGGETFTHVLDKQHTSYSMVESHAEPNVVYASMGTIGIFRSVDFGDTWTKLSGGLPDSNVGVASIAIDPANSQTLYTAISSDQSQGSELNGIYKSSDGGNTWASLPKVPPYFDEDYAYGSSPGNIGQGEYDNCIAVDPTNPNHIVAGGITFIESMDGGQTWKDLTMPTSPDFSSDMHPDFHAVAFASTGDMYVGNDGGVWKKSISGTWGDLNTNLSLTQFYSGMSVGTNNQILGGSQDNGTVLYSGQTGWTHLFDGDGGYTAVDPKNPKIIYAEALGQGNASGADIVRSTDGGNTWDTITPQYEDSNGVPWLTPILLSKENSGTMFVGADRLYKSVDDGQTYSPISSEFEYASSGQSIPDPISVIAQSSSDANVIYVGTSYGQVFATFDGGQNWQSVTPKGADVNSSVTAIVIDAVQPKQITVAFGGFIYPDSNHHVYYTANVAAGQSSWQDITGTLPNSPVNAAVALNGTMFVGTDSGVFEASAGSSNWTQVGTGLPNSPVMSLLVAPNGYLVAGTHGRGAFEYLLPAASASSSSTSSQSQGSSQTPDPSLLTKYQSNYPLYFTQVELNSKPISQPIGLTYQNTTYMPIYYVGSALSAMGFHTSWNGASQSWQITKSGISQSQLYLNAKTGTVNIYVNGKLDAAHVTRVVQIDPYSGKMTTYLPIWFIQQILRSVGISNTWSASGTNKTWDLVYSG